MCLRARPRAPCVFLSGGRALASVGTSLQTAYRAAGGCMWGWWWWWGGVGEKEMGVSHERRWAEERWRASRGIGHSCFLIEPPNTPLTHPPPAPHAPLHPLRHSFRHTAAACVQLESTQQFPPQPADGSEALSTFVWQQPSDGERRVAPPLFFGRVTDEPLHQSRPFGSCARDPHDSQGSVSNVGCTTRRMELPVSTRRSGTREYQRLAFLLLGQQGAPRPVAKG